MPRSTTTLFIYGTLKRGDVRAPLLTGQTYLGEATTAPYYRLFDTGDYPALVLAEPIGLPGRAIVGELWAVDQACLDRLDQEEGVDEGLYARQAIDLSGGQSGGQVGKAASTQSYLYLLPVAGMADGGDRWLAKR